MGLKGIRVEVVKLVETFFHVAIHRFNVESFFVVIGDDHRFDELGNEPFREGLYFALLFVADHVRPIKSQRLIFYIVEVVFEVVDVTAIDEDDFAVFHAFELLSRQ